MHTSRVSSLRRVKEDVREVQAGLECGVGVEGFSEFQEGDVIEAFHTETKDKTRPELPQRAARKDR